MQLGDSVQIDPRLTDLDQWVRGIVFELEDNPYQGPFVYAKTEAGVIYFGRAKYFKPI